MKKAIHGQVQTSPNPKNASLHAGRAQHRQLNTPDTHLHERPPRGVLVNANRLISLRQAKGWHQVDLAEESGLGLTTVGKAERGKRINEKSLGDLAAALAVEPVALLALPSHLDVAEALGIAAAATPHCRYLHCPLRDGSAPLAQHYHTDLANRERGYLAPPDETEQ